MTMSANEHHDDHGLAHVATVKVLLTTITALLILTIATVGATAWDFGRDLNLVIAMVIATIKATLVCMYFMHLRYDKPFHAIAFVSAFLFAILFVGFALMDRGTYLDQIIWDLSNPPTP